jgi:hypothetical protein
MGCFQWCKEHAGCQNRRRCHRRQGQDGIAAAAQGIPAAAPDVELAVLTARADRRLVGRGPDASVVRDAIKFKRVLHAANP